MTKEDFIIWLELQQYPYLDCWLKVEDDLWRFYEPPMTKPYYKNLAPVINLSTPGIVKLTTTKYENGSGVTGLKEVTYETIKEATEKREVDKL